MQWSPTGNHTSLGPSGGSPYGPMLETINNCESLGCLFVHLFSNSLLEMICKETNWYGNEDLVQELEQPERKKKILVPCKASNPHRCHQWKDKWINVTCGCILV